MVCVASILISIYTASVMYHLHLYKYACNIYHLFMIAYRNIHTCIWIYWYIIYICIYITYMYRFVHFFFLWRYQGNKRAIYIYICYEYHIFNDKQSSWAWDSMMDVDVGRSSSPKLGQHPQRFDGRSGSDLEYGLGKSPKRMENWTDGKIKR